MMYDNRCEISTMISKEQANKFYRELCEKIYGDVDTCCGGVMSEELISEHMQMDIDHVRLFCDAMIHYNITERQNHMIVV